MKTPSKTAATSPVERSLVVLSYQGQSEVSTYLSNHGIAPNVTHRKGGGYDISWINGPDVETVRNEAPTVARNQRRACWAFKALETFAEETGMTIKEDGLETVASDFLADLMHLCNRDGLNMPDLLERAKEHYEAELRGE